MPLSELTIDDVSVKTADELRAMIAATEDFPKVEGDIGSLLKKELVDLVLTYLKSKQAPAQAVEQEPDEEKAQEGPGEEKYESEVLLQLKAMGFESKEAAMSMLKSIYKEKALLDHNKKELEDRALELDKREVDFTGLSKWIDNKKRDLEALVLEKKKLIATIEQARAQGIKF